MSFIETFTGLRFYATDPKPESIDIRDIAHALSQLCRYNGHCYRFYSVGEHSCLLADYTLRVTGDPLLALTALLHDGSEAYICDVPKPFKSLLANYAELEAEIELTISKKFGLTFPLPAILKEFDTRILLNEKASLMPDSKQEWGMILPDMAKGPLELTVEGLASPVVEARFLKTFWSLQSDIETAASRTLAPSNHLEARAV